MIIEQIWFKAIYNSLAMQIYACNMVTKCRCEITVH
jgi:hypothetical protein